MAPPRPDLESLDADVRAYIAYLEEALEQAEQESARTSTPAAEPSEAPTTRVVITATRRGTIKRTPRHLYARQRRGGMGVFDLDTAEANPPAFLLVADETDRLLILTNRNRFFAVRVADLQEAEVHSRGESLGKWIPLQPEEEVAVLVPDQGGTYLNLLSDRGWVRRVAGSQLARLASGSVLEVRQGHRPVNACWSHGGQDLLVVTRSGQGIRFEERLVPIQGGCLGIRLDGSDEALAIAAVKEESGVFIASDDGKGTIRQMSGFRANKSPGAGGKVVMKADRVLGAQVAAAGDEISNDVLLISRLGKLIRFAAAEVPPKEGVVQGVNCINLRADEAVAFVVTDAGSPV